MKTFIIPGVLAGTGMLLVSVVAMFVVGMIWPPIAAEYQNINVFRPWADPLMSLYFLHPFLVGFLLVWFYHKVKDSIRGENAIKKGLNFGFSYWLIASIPGMFITLSSFQVSPQMILEWTIMGLVQALVAGVIIAKTAKSTELTTTL